MNIHTRHEPDSQRFVIPLDGDDATLQYAHAGPRTLDYRSTFVPAAYRNKGVGERLVVDALAWARDHGYSVIPTCWFVRGLLKRHKEFQDLIVEQAQSGP